MATVDKILTLLEKQLTGEKEIKGFQGLLKPFNSEMKKWSDESRTAISATAGLADAVMGLGSMAGSAIPHVGKVVIELAKTAVALAEIGIAAARARGEQHVQARAAGTTAAGIDDLAKFFNIFGVGIGKAREMASSSASAANTVITNARAGNREALEKLELAGIEVFDPKTGKARDTAEIVKEAALKGEFFRRQVKDAEDAEDKEQAEKSRKQENAAFDIAGLNAESRSRIAIADIPLESIPEKLKEQESKRPRLSDEEEARFKRVREGWAQFSDAFGAAGEGLARAFHNLGARITDNVMPALLWMGSAALKIGKWFGFIGETPEEEGARKKAEAEQKQQTDEAQQNIAKAQNNYKKVLRDQGTLRDPETGESTEDDPVEPPGAVSSSVTPASKVGKQFFGVATAFNNMDQLTGSTQLQQQASATIQTASQQATYSNVGNDQRQMPVTFNIAANTPAEITGAVQQGLSTAGNLAKENNTSTASITGV